MHLCDIAVKIKGRMNHSASRNGETEWCLHYRKGKWLIIGKGSKRYNPDADDIVGLYTLEATVMWIEQDLAEVVG